MKLAILFEVPDGETNDLAAMAAQLIAHHRFTAENDLPVWSFNTHMRPLGASLADTDEEAVAGLATAVKASGVTTPPV